jgi:hypothetical protein
MTWTPGAAAPKIEIANPTNDYGTCVWSQDGAWLLCAANGPSGLPQHWDLLPYPHGPPIITAAAPGNPIIWLPPPATSTKPTGT